MKIKGDNVCKSYLKVVKFYLKVVSGIIIKGTILGLMSFTVFHKLPKGINLLWENTEYSLGALSAKFSFLLECVCRIL